MTNAQEFECRFCFGSSSKIRYSGVFHKYKKDFGPFDIARCLDCGSLITHPAPTDEALAEFYKQFHLFRGDAYGESEKAGTLNFFYESCFNRLKSNISFNSGDEFTWFDIGCGNGQLAERMLHHYPAAKGAVFDLSDSRPSWVPENLTYSGIDQNRPDFADEIPGQADVVYNNFVLEHMLRPDQYLLNLIKLAKPGGMVFVTCPDASSLFERILGIQWPYNMPGEHVNIPTIYGIRKCLLAQTEKINAHGEVQIDVRSMWIKYGVKYIFEHFGFKTLAMVIPKWVSLPFPSGAMEFSVHIPPITPETVQKPASAITGL